MARSYRFPNGPTGHLRRKAKCRAANPSPNQLQHLSYINRVPNAWRSLTGATSTAAFGTGSFGTGAEWYYPRSYVAPRRQKYFVLAPKAAQMFFVSNRQRWRYHSIQGNGTAGKCGFADDFIRTPAWHFRFA